jgi:hypothetical protein
MMARTNDFDVTVAPDYCAPYVSGLTEAARIAGQRRDRATAINGLPWTVAPVAGVVL